MRGQITRLRTIWKDNWIGKNKNQQAFADKNWENLVECRVFLKGNGEEFGEVSKVWVDLFEISEIQEGFRSCTPRENFPPKWKKYGLEFAEKFQRINEQKHQIFWLFVH